MYVQILSYFDLKILMPMIRLCQLLIVAITSINLGYNDYPKQATVSDGAEFDFVVVGAGSAGCVLANRLTEVPEWTVLLIEAGDDPPFIASNPSLSVFVASALPDWSYYSEDDGYSSQALRTRSIRTLRGKMLGGSSSINYLYYVRGNKVDYDNWAQDGNEGWDWENVMHYFKKMERLEDEELLQNSLNYRGANGFVGVTRPIWEDETKVYLESFKEIGHDVLEDLNGAEQMGYSVAQFSVADGIRQSTSAAYLQPIKDRSNLFVLKNTLARKVLFDNNKIARSVEIKLPNGEIVKVMAKKEVILSAGAVNSPQLLMLSGVGPRKHLSDIDIEVIFDSSNVGQNLQDHMMVHVMLTTRNESTSIFNNIGLMRHMDKFPIPTIMGFVALNKTQGFPDYQTTVCPLAGAHLMNMVSCTQILGFDDDSCMHIVSYGKRGETLHSLISLLHPESRGRIKLKSNDPEELPLIYSGYFSNANDIEKLATSIEDYLTVLKASHFKKLRSEIVDLKIKQCKEFAFGSHDYWKCYVLNTAGSHYHPAGTCAMGPEGVVDERLRVRGVRGLRVVDASVMPTITSGNINAPVIMIAEKASDLIKADSLPIHQNKMR